LIGADNYESALAFFKSKLSETPFISFDIETSTPPESDEWLAKMKGASEDDSDLGVDVLGSFLVGMAVTFGHNRNYTFYLTVRHNEADGVKNISSMDALVFMDAIGTEKPIIIQNTAFELPVLYQEWSHEWDTGYFRGFVPNVYDTAIMARFVDENIQAGLKFRSKYHLGYVQQTYQETTCITMKPEAWDGKGKIVLPASEANDYHVTVQYKMDELSATHVLGYGSDDTICTSALYNHYRMVMEIEDTWDVFKMYELGTAYVFAKAFVDGFKASLERLREIAEDDEVSYAKAEKVVNKYLTEKDWVGTRPPVYTEITPAVIKEVFEIVMGRPLKTTTRTVSKFPELLKLEDADILAEIVKSGNAKKLTQYAQQHYDCKPILNFDSPAQMKKLLYYTMDLPVRIVNSLTDKQREGNKKLSEAVFKFMKIQKGSKSTPPLTAEELELLKEKAATNDTAFDFALKYDAKGEVKEFIEALRVMKTVNTRRKFYYRKYPVSVHWKTGRIHYNPKQSSQVTGRNGASDPNIAQLSKRGEGVKVRQVVQPHVPGGSVNSIDFSGQELRLMAGQSRDANMMSCYIGDNKKDIHSITAAGAMVTLWGEDKLQEYIEKFGKDLMQDDPDFLYKLFRILYKSEDDEIAKLADDHRKDAKNVNFATQFDAQAAKLAEMLVITLEEAQAFLDAKYAMFPDVEVFKEEVRKQLMATGIVKTMLGRRRHLRHAVLDPNKWERARAGRQGPNYTIQGSAAEQTKLAMSRIWDSGILYNMDIQFIGPVHDELVWSSAPECTYESFEVIHACMCQPYSTLPVPIVGSCSLGPNFGQQIELGDEVDRVAFKEAIQAAVKKNPSLGMTQLLEVL
jgi:DNA polymerase I-like protein with 3'-5' exonuclease and polymerase domains